MKVPLWAGRIDCFQQEQYEHEVHEERTELFRKIEQHLRFINGSLQEMVGILRAHYMEKQPRN